MQAKKQLTLSRNDVRRVSSQTMTSTKRRRLATRSGLIAAAAATAPSLSPTPHQHQLRSVKRRYQRNERWWPVCRCRLAGIKRQLPVWLRRHWTAPACNAA